MLEDTPNAGSSRIRLLRSSSTHLAFIFSLFIFSAIALICYELYVSRIGIIPPRWIIYLSLGLLLSIAVGLFVVGFYVTKRINGIVETAERIMRTGDISQRIPVYQHWDDLSALSETLNLMLAEIETLVQGIRTVSDNISHDLRHPLTRMRNTLEDARSKTHIHSADEQKKLLTDLIGECDSLLITFSALLRISNVESAKRHSGFESLALHNIVNDVLELYEPLAHDKNIVFATSIKDAPIVGDKDLLFQAITNLIDNAIKYSPNNGTIHIRLHTSKRSTTLEIEDEGDGIPSEHRNKVFNRFYRVEASRSTPGSGLGLSLVRAIIELHKGKISLTDGQNKGTLVRISL